MPINHATLEMLRKIQPDDEPDFVRRIMIIYLESAEKAIQELKQALQDSNLEPLTRSAHSLKSSSRNIGAMELSNLSEQLEHDCRRNNLSYVDQQIDAIINEYSRVSTYLSEKILKSSK